jgi:hypothetical protein
MIDLNDLSRNALAAAMRGGTEGWGQVASSERNIRYSQPRPKKPGRKKKCWCGCGGHRTHLGMANGICLTSACELGIARWVKTGKVRAPLPEGKKP